MTYAGKYKILEQDKNLEEAWDHWCSRAGLRSERLNEVESMIQEYEDPNSLFGRKSYDESDRIAMDHVVAMWEYLAEIEQHALEVVRAREGVDSPSLD